MTLLDFVLLALASNAVVTAWFYGSIFEKLREYFAKRGGLLGELMRCWLCLPYHVAFWSVVLMWLPGFFLGEPLRTFSRLPVYAFALTTLIHFLQWFSPFDDSETDDTGNQK